MRLDLALVENVIARQEIRTTPILDDTLCLICGNRHPFAARTSVTLDEPAGSDICHEGVRQRHQGHV